jgi:hypothetical protein
MYPIATRPQTAAAVPHKTRSVLPWAIVVAVLCMCMGALAIIARQVTPTPVPPCTTRCAPPPPPVGSPLPAQHRYTSSAFGYSLAYTDQLGPPTINDDHSVGWQGTLTNGNAVLLKITAEHANGRNPQQVMQAVQQSVIPGATPVYTIPNAELGYTLGYGSIYDVFVSPPSGLREEDHVVIEVVVKNDIAIELIGVSPYVEDNNPHPSPAQMDPFVERFADVVGNTVIWQGERPR